MPEVYAFGDRQSWDKAVEGINKALSPEYTSESRNMQDTLNPVVWGKVVADWTPSNGNSITLRPFYHNGEDMGADDVVGNDDAVVMIIWPSSTTVDDAAWLVQDAIVPYIPFGSDDVDGDKSGVLLTSIDTLGVSEYAGPFRVEKLSGTSVRVGTDNYDRTKSPDIVTIYQADGTVEDITKSTEEFVVGISASCWVYLACYRESTGWDYDMLTSTVWPPAETAANKDQVFVQVAYITYTSEITGIYQLLRGCPVIWERPILTNGQAVYNNDQMTVTGMKVNVNNQTATMSAISKPLSVGGSVYVQATYTEATNAWAITPGYQWTVSAVVPYAESSGVHTFQWEVAEILSDRIYQRRTGNIEYPGVSSVTGGLLSTDTYVSYSTDHDGTTGWHPRGFWATITSETATDGTYNFQADDKPTLTFTATEQSEITGLPSGGAYYIQKSNSGTGDKYYFMAHYLPDTSPSSPKTLGSASEGSETASTDTWTMGVDGPLEEWKVWRNVYNHAGNKVLYMMMRKTTTDEQGHKVKVSGETRVTVDAAEAC